MIINIVLLAAGVISHVGFFNNGEHHMHGLQYLQLCLSVIIISALALIGSTHVASGQAIGAVTHYLGFYLAGLYSSLVIYRLFFHPLKHFAGPFSVKISNLCFSARLINLNAHKKVLALHEKYGDFVRIGSSDLSIIHPKAPDAIYGRKSKCTKANWYDLTLPMTSMQTTRKRVEHDKRRKVWGGAFNDTILRGYEDRIAIYQKEMHTKISSYGSKAINVTELYHQFSFDVMGDLSFGASFNMLKSGGDHGPIKLLRRGMAPLGLMFPTWCFRLLLAIPGATGDWFAFKDYCCELLDKRLKTKVITPNLTSFLIEPWKDTTPTGYDLNMLQGDSQLIIVAGSDTTASTLTNTSYELAKQPHLISQLRDALFPFINSSEGITNQNLQSLDLLNGIINETLRLHPPVLALQRKTPPEGLMIGETYVPGNMTVWCPQYVIGRSEEVYTDASSFVPERWYSKREMIKESSAYAPFSLGTYNCIGKPLALMTLRTTLAKLILDFDISFAAGDDGTAFENGTKTQFNTLPGPLNLLFRKR